MNALRHYVSLPLRLCAAALVVLLTGCSANFVPGTSADTEQTPIGTIHGRAFGGNAPIVGAQIYLFATGTGGYQGVKYNGATYTTPATSLITKGKTGVNCNTSGTFNGDCYVTTGADGTFDLGGDYTCTAGTQVYAVAYAGNPGLANGTNNTYIVQMAGVGNCPTGGATSLGEEVPYLDINEVSTVVFAYAMGGFATDEVHISADASGATAIQNAMANVTNIMNIGTGLVYPTTVANPNGAVPADKIYALANILAACVNTTGPDADTKEPYSETTTGKGNDKTTTYTLNTCGQLFEYTGSLTQTNSTTQPTITGTPNEAQAIFYIVHNPTLNVNNLFGIATSNKIFANNLQPYPADWTLPIVYSGAVSKPGNISFDSLGDAWISDIDGDAVVQMSPQGARTALTDLNHGGANGSISQVVVDPSDNVWALDNSYSQIYRLDPTGKWESTITATGANELSAPVAVSFNTAGTAQVLNSGDTYISRFGSSGVAQTPATYNQSGGYTGGSLGSPLALAVDSGGNTFVPENGGSGCQCMGVLSNGGPAVVAYDDDSGTMESASAIAIDASNDPWHAEPAQNEIVEDPVSSSYQDYNIAGDPLFGTGALHGYYFNVTVSTYNIIIAQWQEAAASTPTTITGGGLNKPASLAFDGKGYLWAANSGASTVSAFSGTTSEAGTTGLQTGSSGVTYAAAPDPSGNLWTANSDGTVTQILGLATPTYAPAYPGHFGTEP